MQVNNNNQLSFKSVRYEAHVKDEIPKVLKKRIKPAELDRFIKRLDESPVQAVLGLADGNGHTRLDAHLEYKSPEHKNPAFKEYYSYIEENVLFNIFNFKPRKFMHKVLSELNTIEETYGIGKYAK